MQAVTGDNLYVSRLSLLMDTEDKKVVTDLLGQLGHCLVLFRKRVRMIQKIVYPLCGSVKVENKRVVASPAFAEFCTLFTEMEMSFSLLIFPSPNEELLKLTSLEDAEKHSQEKLRRLDIPLQQLGKLDIFLGRVTNQLEKLQRLDPWIKERLGEPETGAFDTLLASLNRYLEETRLMISMIQSIPLNGY